MRHISWLQKLFNIAYYLLILFAIYIVSVLIYSAAYSPETFYNQFKTPGGEEISSTSEFYTMGFYLLIYSGLWIHLFRIIRKVMSSFSKNSIFNKLQITGFRLIGKFLIIISIIDVIAELAYSLIFEGKTRIIFDPFSKFWILLALGIFLLFLSDVFRKAKEYREENELTV